MATIAQLVSTNVQAAARTRALTVLSGRVWADLVSELGSGRRATRWLIREATKIQTPIGVNIPSPVADGSSHTLMISPRGWSEERLEGWVGARHAELSKMFGEARVVNKEAVLTGATRPLRRTRP